MYVTEDGPPGAPPLLLVHGFSSSGASWSRVVPALADAFRVVRVDLLGHGRTGGRAADAPEQAAAVARELAARGLVGVTAVGHSFGADVAVALAGDARVGRLVIVAQAPDYTDATLPRAGSLMTRRLSPLAYAGARPAMRALRLVAGRVPTDGGRLVAQGLADLDALDPRMFRVVLVDRGARLAATPLDAQVRAAGKPTLVVLGGRDGFYGARSAPRYAAAGARVEVLPTSGHAVPVEQPAALAALIRGFAV